MNQIQLIAQSILKYLGGIITAKGYADSSTVEAIIGGLMALGGALWHWWHLSTVTAQTTKP